MKQPKSPASAHGGDLVLRTPADRLQRATLLDQPAFRALEASRREIEARFGPTPHADPLDGGAAASLLLLLETPGPSQEQPRFVSRDNPTGTARNLRRFTTEAGLARADTLIWNVVPWHIHAPGARNRAPRRAEIAAGLALLPGFLALLPRLRVIVMAGRVAGLARPLLEAGHPHRVVLAMPHPSPTYVCTSPEIGRRIAETLRRAAELLQKSSDD